MSLSDKLFNRAKELLPGGVNSPVRAFRAVGGTPPVYKSGSGSRVVDVDGKAYLDFVCSWGPLILGHAHPEVVGVVKETVSNGMTFGAPCEMEVELAQEVINSYPGIEQIRFVSSGTEATMSAIRLARGVTGRDLILKFSGCYHGHADHLLVAAGSGLVTFGQPSSAGVPKSFAEQTLVLPLDDEERLRDLFKREGDRIAAVIVEPIPANNGLLIQRREFLQSLRDVTKESGSLLIFDEVISGFRVGLGGAAELYGITPDLVTFGKVIGGGMPVGAFGASREITKHLAPEGPVYQAGTLSGNPVAMAAGLATVQILKRERAWEKLEDLGRGLEDRLGSVLSNAPFPVQLARVGSIFWFCFQDGPLPASAEAIGAGGADIYGKVFHKLLDRGVAMAPSAYEVGFLSLAHTEDDLDRYVTELDTAFQEVGS